MNVNGINPNTLLTFKCPWYLTDHCCSLAKLLTLVLDFLVGVHIDHGFSLSQSWLFSLVALFFFTFKKLTYMTDSMTYSATISILHKPTHFWVALKIMSLGFVLSYFLNNGFRRKFHIIFWINFSHYPMKEFERLSII
jgi:hypothetical protein